MKRYKIVEASSPEELALDVMDSHRKGWGISGGVSVIAVQGEVDLEWWYSQAMYHEFKEDLEPDD